MPLDLADLRKQFRTAKSELLAQFEHSRPTTSSASHFLKRLARTG
jgi:[protein-PII] uridylyltransferase